MISWIGENFASIALFLVVALIVFLLIKSMIKERKNGTCGCGCGCAGCSGCGAHRKKEETHETYRDQA